MFENPTKVLLILSRDVLDEARIFAGRATTELKRAVSLQIVLRALIEEGLKRSNDRTLLANIQAQADAVREIRSLARQRAMAGAPKRTSRRPVPVRSRSK